MLPLDEIAWFVSLQLTRLLPIFSRLVDPRRGEKFLRYKDVVYVSNDEVAGMPISLYQHLLSLDAVAAVSILLALIRSKAT